MKAMKRFAAFLDRDGVINFESGNIKSVEELIILPRVPEAIRLLNEHKIPVVVVTNQPVVARGWATEQKVKEINKEIGEILEERGAKITAFYFCPHHPNADLEKYRVVCNCRKPNTGLYEQAAKKYKLDVQKSFIVGDSFRDIEVAKKLGCPSIAVECGVSDFRDSKPDYRVKDLYSAVELMLSLTD